MKYSSDQLFTVDIKCAAEVAAIRAKLFEIDPTIQSMINGYIDNYIMTRELSSEYYKLPEEFPFCAVGLS